MSKPEPKSFDQINGEMLADYLSKIGIDDLNTGSAMTSFFEAIALKIYRATGDQFSILRDKSVDRATGKVLKDIAQEENVKLEKASVATGKVTIRDTRFEKIATKIYAGASAPNIGTTSLKVSDASLFALSGAIYIGRGTPNIEGPINYTSKTQVGGFWELTLASPTTKFHNISESVVLAQGGVRNIPVNTIVSSPSAGGASNVDFKTSKAALILDGENIIANVPVAATQLGSDGNVPRGSIRTFGSLPFVGASVTNDQSFNTGRNEMTDEEIRDKIKRTRMSRGLGTAIAIKNSTLGTQANDENSRVVSNEILSDVDFATLFIDNGEGYEEKSKGVGLEYIVDSAIGGEQRFQLKTSGTQTSVAKAFLESAQQAPYSIKPTDRLALLIGGVLSEHIFGEDFRSNGFATAYEVVASINANPELAFVARTSNDGTKVVVEAKVEQNEYIQTTTPTQGGDASVALTFTSNEVQTLRLYKNRQPLSKDGRFARVESNNQSDWSNTLATNETLIIALDGTNFLTYNFTNNDFIQEGSYTTLSKANSLQSWANVINAKVTGASAIINGNRLVILSNLGAVSRAKIEIDPSSTMVSKGIFNVNNLSSQGKAADFTLSRNTAQFKLITPLKKGDSLSAGTEFSKASIETGNILGNSVTFTSDAYFWFLVDESNAQIIPTGVVADTFLTISKPQSQIIRFTSSVALAFANVKEGDYLILWSNDVNVNNRFEARVHALTNNTLDIKVTTSEYNNAIDQALIQFKDGFVVVRTTSTPQCVIFPTGNYNINVVANELSERVVGMYTNTIDDEIIILNTKSEANDGSLMVVAFNEPARVLNLNAGATSTSINSHYAFYETKTQDSNIPLFVHGKIVDQHASSFGESSVSTFESDIDFTNEGFEPSDLVVFKHPLLTNGDLIEDAQPNSEYTLIKDFNNTIVNIEESPFVKRLRIDDRFYLSRGFDLSHNDFLVVVLDEDVSNKTFSIPLYRRIVTNTSSTPDAIDFRAYDVEAGPTSEFSNEFANLNFDNYKAFMKARNVLDPKSLVDQDAILFKASFYGEAGEMVKIAYQYPTSENSPIKHTIEIGNEVLVNVFLKSGNPIPKQIDGTTEWDVTITPNTPSLGVDEVSYSWNGVGTNPSMTTLSQGHYVTINSNGEFASDNQGTFKVQSATSTSFTIHRPNGIAIAQNGVATLTTSTIFLYLNADTSALEIVDYVNASLIDFISASLVEDNGLGGSGVINTSTYEDNGFDDSFAYLTLVDGINYISKATLFTSAPNTQFEFKNPLQLVTYDTNTLNAYTFTNGEEIYLVPITAHQISELISILAVSGITTLGKVNTSNRDRQLQLTTNILGSSGSIQITGGSANAANAQVIGQTTNTFNTNLSRASISRASSFGFHNNQLVKIQNNTSQKKDTEINNLTMVNILPNTIVAGKSVIELTNKDSHTRYFGQPYSSFRDGNRAFHIEKHGVFTCLVWDGVGTNPWFTKNVEINSDNGMVQVQYNNITGLTSYTVTSGSRNFSEVSVNDVLTTSNFVDSSNNGSFVVQGISSDKKTIVVDNIFAINTIPTIVNASDLTISSQINEGDVVVISSPFASLNQGKFTIIKRYKDSVYYENASSIEERVNIPNNYTSVISTPTTFNVIDNGNMRIEWDNIGTLPLTNLVKMGDVVELGSSFNIANQGVFMVTKSSLAMKEKFVIQLPDANTLSGSQRLHFSLPNGTDYYLWFNLNGASSDPAPVGRVGIPVLYTGSESSSNLALLVLNALSSIVGLSASVLANSITVEMADYGPCLHANNVDIRNTNVFSIQHGSLSFIECANSKVIAQNGVVVSNIGSNTLQYHRPSIVMSTYENTLVGDAFSISGNVLGVSNKGYYSIEEVLDESRIVVNGLLSIVNEIPLMDNYLQLYVEEERPFVGYKTIYNILPDPTNDSRSIVLFSSNYQSFKINNVGESMLIGMGKLDIPSINRKGLDSYRYNTGLIAQVNKVVYGDPRDSITYPGVSAAGAEIYIKAPLVKRISVSIAVRIRTGIPYSRVVEQVRNNIQSLINSTPIGKSIAISDIITTVNSIQGVDAVSISSPQYNVANDVIAIAAEEKPLIIDASTDIIVSKV